MRPSGPLLQEPGAEHSMPQGRDLFTFVTSAASHMMRTLQRPRKSRPSKRQVNHRRFLHDMIHRKFAEIEAANRQLSSAIFSREGEDAQASSPIYVSSDQSEDVPGEESSAGQLPPTLSSGSRSLGLSSFSPDSTMPSNRPQEPNSLWAFNLQLESPVEITALPYCQTSTESGQLTLQRGCWGIAEEERFSKWFSVDTYGPSPDAQACENLQHEPVQIDSFIKLADNIQDENARSLVEKAHECQVIRSSPELDPNQQCNASSLTPDIRVPNLSPTPPLDPQSLSSCASGIQIAANSHCSLTEMGNILKNPQSDIPDSFYPKDPGPSVGEPLPSAEPVWAPPSQDLNYQNLQFGDSFLHADFDISSYSADNLICSRKAIAKQNTGMRRFNGTNRSDPDYLPACFSHFDALVQPRMGDCRESVDAVRDLGITYSWPPDPTSITKTKTQVLSSVSEGKNKFCKNYMAGCDSSLIIGPDLLSLVHSNKGDTQCALEDRQLQETGSEKQGMVPSTCLNPSLVLDTGLDQSSIPLRCHRVPPNPTSFPNSCSPVSSCMRGGGYQYHSAFMDVAKFQSQKPHARQILTPPLEDYWLFDNILGEHESRGIETGSS